MAATWWAWLDGPAAVAELGDDTVGLLDDRSDHITLLIRFLPLLPPNCTYQGGVLS
jgi:hypothetical protein